MKKYTFLLLGLLFSFNLLNAADVNHQSQTICETDTKPQFSTTNTGDTYTWYKKQTNGSWTQVSSGSNKYTPTDAGEYKCVVEKSGTTEDTGNLITLGGFEFPANNPKFSETNRLGSNVWYQYLNFDRNGKDIAIGATTTHTNANNVKEKYFTKLKPYKGNYLFVCDGANSSSARVWQAGGIKLPKGKYQFSCHVANIDSAYSSHGTNSLAKLKFVIKNDDGEQELLSFTAPSQLGKWDERKAVFEATKDYSWCDIYIVNFTTEPEGNDFALDEIYFGTEITTTGTKDNEFFELKIDSKPTITMPTIADQCPNTSVEIKPTVLKVGSSPKYTWTGDATGNLINTTITSASNVNGLKKCSLKVENGKCTSTADITIKTKDCGRTETNNHPAVTVCTNQNVTLKCDKTGNSVTWNDPSLTGTEVTVTSSSSVGADDKYTCTIITTENGNTVTYIENFTVKTKDCSITIESTMCNNAADSTLKASKTGTNYEYHWTLPNGITRITETDTIQIRPTNANVGEVLEYSCEIYEIPVSNPAPNAPIAGRPPMLLGTDNFEITIRDCIVETDEEEDLQTKEDGSITLIVPEANRCNGCKYYWYKRNEDGSKGEAVAKNAGEEAWEHTVYNATADGYMCEIIAPNGNKHTQTYKISVYTPKTSTYCFTEDSEEDQKKTITLTEGNRNEYEWYWRKDNQDIPFPESSISTEENNITLDLAYFVNNSNSNFPVKVHIIEKYAHKLETTALNNDDIIDEDGDGFVMWKDEHIVTIYPNTTQTITEVSGPNQEYEKEVALPMGEKITFRYDPSTYTDGMTKYEANDYRTDEYGCNHSVYFTLNLISIEPMIFFSPNNDGVNDLWLVEGIETAPNAYIRIYDRYSKLLYQCKGADFKGWDGNYNGHGMVQDDYWYVISIPETEEQISGHFTLKR